MIGALSKEPETRGLPELLLLATRCAVGAGPEIRGVEIPGLADLAALTKPKRVGIEARRLAEAITTPVRPHHRFCNRSLTARWRCGAKGASSSSIFASS